MFCDGHLTAPAPQRAGWLSAAKRREKMKVDASNIAPRLWIGAKPPFDHEITGIDVLVLCAREIQPSSMAFKGRVLRCPINDADLSSREIATVAIAARDVTRSIAAGKRVLVTCAMGRNRSALVTGLALGQLTLMNWQQIVALIRARRHPECLSNDAFLRYLERFVGDGREKRR